MKLNLNLQNATHSRLILNNIFTGMVCDYLNSAPCFVTSELLNQIDPEHYFSVQRNYITLLSAWLGLEPELNEQDSEIENGYLRNAVTRLNNSDYDNDEYVQEIKFPELSYKNWTFKFDTVEAYEGVVWRENCVDEEGRSVAQIGFFEAPLKYPAVYENGREWMAVKPSEIETMRDPIDQMRGNVLVLGLGLGYFAFHCARKKDVNHVTVVERSGEVIELFKKYLLPQMSCRDKITIIKSDAFEFMNHLNLSQMIYDTAFVDLWRDASDGMLIYEAFKPLEGRSPRTKFVYWVESTLLEAIHFRDLESV